MTVPRASVRFATGLVIVEFVSIPRARILRFEGVVDRTALGDIVGLEVLDLRKQLGDVSLPGHACENLPRWSYDDEVDAFYLRLMDATASLQRSTIGSAALDDAGRSVAVEILSGS